MMTIAMTTLIRSSSILIFLLCYSVSQQTGVYFFQFLCRQLNDIYQDKGLSRNTTDTSPSSVRHVHPRPPVQCLSVGDNEIAGTGPSKLWVFHTTHPMGFKLYLTENLWTVIDSLKLVKRQDTGSLCG